MCARGQNEKFTRIYTYYFLQLTELFIFYLFMRAPYIIELRHRLMVALALSGVLSIVAACAGLTQKPPPPRISVVGLEVVQMGVLEQQYVLKLRLQNTNDVDLTIKGMDYELFINDHPFAYGVSRELVQLPSFGEAILELELISSLARVFEQLQAWETALNKHVNYRIIGSAKLNNWPRKIPFETKGEIAIPQKDKHS